MVIRLIYLSIIILAGCNKSYSLPIVLQYYIPRVFGVKLNHVADLKTLWAVLPEKRV